MNRSYLLALAFFTVPLIAAAPARADEAAGEAVFKKYCQVCHATEAGKNKIGPSLAGIVGRKAGSVEGFHYSEANKNSGLTWDEATRCFSGEIIASRMSSPESLILVSSMQAKFLSAIHSAEGRRTQCRRSARSGLFPRQLLPNCLTPFLCTSPDQSGKG